VSLGLRELLIILLIVLILFGGRKLPELARSLGKAVRSFREESERLRKDLDEGRHDEHDEEGPRPS